MALFNWTEDYSVKVNGLDNQHKKLVDLINDLHSAMKEGKSKEVLGRIINELISYTKFHFTAEENLMLQNKYPEYAKHKEEHEAFTKKVMEFEEKFSRGSVVLSQEIIIFLKDWLINHIQGTDKNYSPYLSNKVVA